MSKYNTDDVKEVSYMTPGLRKEGCQLIKVEYEKPTTGNESINFTFKDPTGAILTHKVYEPQDSFNGVELTPEKLKTAINMAIGSIKHILGRFIPEEATKITGDTWEELGANTVRALGQSHIGIKCALKVTLRKGEKDGKTTYYSILPKVPAFISTEKYPKEFTVNPDWDLFEIPGTKPDKNNDAPTSKPEEADF